MVISISLYLNGKKYKLSQTITLTQLLQYFDYTNEIFVIEYNKIICNQKDWNNIKLSNNDILEIVTIVGGG